MNNGEKRDRNLKEVLADIKSKIKERQINTVGIPANASTNYTGGG